jgi:hypothetical protein
MEFVRDEVASDQRHINAIHVEVQMAELELKRVAKDIDNIKEDMDNLKVKMDSTTTAEREKWLDSMQLENLTVRKKHLLDEKLMWLARWDRLSTLMLAQNSCELTVDLCDMCASECVNMATIVPRRINAGYCSGLHFMAEPGFATPCCVFTHRYCHSRSSKTLGLYQGRTFTSSVTFFRSICHS